MNREFQNKKPRIHKIIPTFTAYYKTILKFYMKPDIVNKIPIHVINPKNPDYFLAIESIEFGANFETILSENRHNISQNDLSQIRLNCLNFYIQLCTEIRNRIDFNNEILKQISTVFEIYNIFSDKKASIVQLAKCFPNILNPLKLEDLAFEWKLLNEYKPKELLSDVETFIEYVKQQKNSFDEPAFKTLTDFAQAIISLPHGSASAERLFSTLNIIKNKHRNCLNISTVENLLFCKHLLKSNTCYQWTPSEELINFNK